MEEDTVPLALGEIGRIEVESRHEKDCVGRVSGGAWIQFTIFPFCVRLKYSKVHTL